VLYNPDMARPVRKVKPCPPRYEKRVVLFIDFLGFKEHVVRTTKDPEFLAVLAAAMDVIGQIGADNQDLCRSQRVTQFSDSIVVSFRIEERSAVFWLLHDIATVVLDLARRGFLVRGAVTVGDLLHTKKHLVGPAMVEAYEHESKFAKFPRVLIDEKVLDVARKARSEDHSQKEEEEYARSFITRDNDALNFLEYVSFKSVVAVVGVPDERYGPYLARIGELIRQGLSSEDPRVLEKYLWLHRQYVAAIEEFAQMPPGHPYRQQSPANCRTIESLKKMNSLAKTALNSLKKYQKREQQIAKLARKL
jgi:hypothetical protein